MAPTEFSNFHKLGASTTLEGQRGDRLKIAGCSLHCISGTSNHANLFQMLASRKMDLEIKYYFLNVIYYNNLSFLFKIDTYHHCSLKILIYLGWLSDSSIMQRRTI